MAEPLPETFASSVSDVRIMLAVLWGSVETDGTIEFCLCHYLYASIAIILAAGSRPRIYIVTTCLHTRCKR